MEKIKKFLKDEEGVSAIEYALIAGIVTVGLTVALGNFRTDIETLLGVGGGQIATALD